MKSWYIQKVVRDGIPMTIKVKLSMKKPEDVNENTVKVIIRYWHPLFWVYFMNAWWSSFRHIRKERKEGKIK